MSFEDLKLHGYLDIFLLGVNRSGPRRDQHPIIDFTGIWDDFMVHGVKL